MVFEYSKCIHARYEHFIARSQCQTQKYKTKEELLTQIMCISVQLEDVGISLKTLN